MELKKRSISLVFSALLIAVLVVFPGCQTPPKATDTPDEPVVTESQSTPVAEPIPVEDIEPTAPEEVADDTSGGKTTHVVEEGDCLWNIAESEEVYDDPFQWPLIYKENRDQIKDPDLIFPDQEFSIPRDSSDADVDEAIHEAKTRGPWSLWDGK